MQDKELFNMVLGEGEEILKTYRRCCFYCWLAFVVGAWQLTERVAALQAS